MASGTPCFKVILVGEYGVGKSSVFRRFVDNTFTTESGRSSTLGLDNFSKPFKFGNEEIKLELWDTAGIERFSTLSMSYFQRASAAILCFSMVDRESFGYMSQHLLDTVMHTRTAKIFLCGNKLDLVSETDQDKVVTDSDIERFMDECDTVLCGSYKVSCESNEGIKEMFQSIAHVVFGEVGARIDHSRIQVTKSLPQPEGKEKKCCD